MNCNGVEKSVKCPVITVIVPSFNKVDCLIDCLNSIRNQTWCCWECIIVDDGSTKLDEIEAIVGQMEDQRFRILVLGANRGPAAARNAGVCQARGEYVICVDEDDMLEPNALSELMTELLNNDADVVVPGFSYCGELSGSRIPNLPKKPEFLVRQGLLAAGFLMKRETWLKLGGFDESPQMRHAREDFEFWLRVLSSDCKVHVYPKALYKYRREMLEKSREVSQRLYEVKARLAVIRKHSRLYRVHKRELLRYLADGYDTEAVARWEARERMRAIWCTFIAFVLQPDWKRFTRLGKYGVRLLA